MGHGPLGGVSFQWVSFHPGSLSRYELVQNTVLVPFAASREKTTTGEGRSSSLWMPGSGLCGSSL